MSSNLSKTQRNLRICFVGFPKDLKTPKEPYIREQYFEIWIDFYALTHLIYLLDWGHNFVFCNNNQFPSYFSIQKLTIDEPVKIVERRREISEIIIIDSKDGSGLIIILVFQPKIIKGKHFYPECILCISFGL